MPSQFQFSETLEAKPCCCPNLYDGEMMNLEIISAPEWVSGWKWTCSQTAPPLKINVLHSCRTQRMLPVKEAMAVTGSCLFSEHLGKSREMSACWLLLVASFPSAVLPSLFQWRLLLGFAQQWNTCLLPSALCSMQGNAYVQAEAEAMQTRKSLPLQLKIFIIWRNSL